MYKDQEHIADKFAQVVSSRILTAEGIAAQLLSERSRSKILDMARDEVGPLLDRYASEPLIQTMLSAEQVEALRLRALRTIDEKLGSMDGPLAAFASREGSFQSALRTKIRALEPAILEKIWRPVVQADEWKLMAVGGALGAVAGALQTVYLVGRMLSSG
jgi:uncharacterized membrane protein YheB (UPF0754 family)